MTIYFLNEGVYKSFNINLQNGIYNYSFDWTQGEIEDYSMRRDNIVEDEVEDTFLIPNSSVSSDNISPPELNLLLYPNPYN